MLTPAVDSTYETQSSPLHPTEALRSLVRGIIVLGIAATALLEYWIQIRPITAGKLRMQAAWLYRLCRKLVKVTGVRVDIQGEVPATGLIVANHLGYVDIILLSAIARPVFVSKAEVEHWPLFGICAECAGTIFVDRNRRTAVAPAVEKMRDVLAAGLPVVLFPEGMSSGGESVLPFKPSLFAAVTTLGCPVTPCGIRFYLENGSVSDEICYWGDHSLLPHLINLLGKTGISARFVFGATRHYPEDRKAVAQALHSEVTRLHAMLPRENA